MLYPGDERNSILWLPGRFDRHSFGTLAAVGFLAYYVIVMWHEIVGHGSAMYLLGARHFVLTSTSIDSGDLQFDDQKLTLGDRLVFMAGPIANVVLGLLVYPLFRFASRRNANLALRLFLSLLTAVNLFIGFVSPLYSGIFGVGDFTDAIASLPHHGLLRALELAVGAVFCAGIVRFFAASFAGFPENLWRLSLIPYFSAALVFCVAGLRIPNGTRDMIISVIPAALLGQSILLFITPMARKLRQKAPLQKAIPASPTAIVLALVFVAMILLTAPGVRFTMP